jgi:transposase
MRSVGLDLGGRKIAFCEVDRVQDQVIDRRTVRVIENLERQLGPNTPPARVAFEACREAWHVHDVLTGWGHHPIMIDTTRTQQIGIGDHKRKNDRIDAELLAWAAAKGRLPVAHVLSAERRELRAQLGVRRTLVETRAQYVTSIRGLVRSCVCPTASIREPA